MKRGNVGGAFLSKPLTSGNISNRLNTLSVFG